MIRRDDATGDEMGNPQTTAPKTQLSADQVAWTKDVLTRHATAIRIAHDQPDISRLAQAADLAALLELMEVLNLEFEDEAAANTALYGLYESPPYGH